MTNPQRYGASAAPCDTGIFVMHADYEKVAAERDALLAACRTAVMALAYASKDNPNCHPAYQAVSEAIEAAVKEQS